MNERIGRPSNFQRFTLKAEILLSYGIPSVFKSVVQFLLLRERNNFSAYFCTKRFVC
jgi:hypothetical protein